MKKIALLSLISMFVVFLLARVGYAIDLSECTNMNDILDIEVKFSDEKIKPYEEIEVKITFENNDDDIDIEDLDYELWFEDSSGRKLEDIDEDDIEEDDTIDVDADDEEKVEYSWLPNQDFDDGDKYYLIIKAKGYDKDNSSNVICAYINQSDDESIEFERESHKLEIYKASAGVVSVNEDCERKIRVKVGVRNIGEHDEDDAVLTITSDELGVSKEVNLPELDKDYDDEDNSVEETIEFSVPASVKEGTYSIDIELSYRNGREKESKSVDVEIDECEVEEQEEEEEEEEQEEVIIVPQEEQAVAEPVVEPSVSKVEESFFEKYSLWLIVLAYIVVLGVGIPLIVKFLRK